MQANAKQVVMISLLELVLGMVVILAYAVASA
jgi:hypothetical protein